MFHQTESSEASEQILPRWVTYGGSWHFQLPNILPFFDTFYSKPPPYIDVETLENMYISTWSFLEMQYSFFEWSNQRSQEFV